jgi:hypothetical protein
MQTTHKSTVYVFRDENEQQQSRVFAWINDVSSRMWSNRQLNTVETEVVLFVSVHLQHQIPTVLLTVGSDLVPTVRDLGIQPSLILSYISTPMQYTDFTVLRQIRSIMISQLFDLAVT